MSPVPNTWFVQVRRRWRPRLVWLWLRQGRPGDFPVIIREGRIVATARAVDADGEPIVEAEDVLVEGWSFGHGMMDPGMIHMHDVVHGLLRRRLGTVVFPDGHTELRRLRFDEEPPP